MFTRGSYLVALTLAVAAPSGLYAQISHTTGVIRQIDATAGGNLGLRVWFTGNPNFCGSSDGNFAYIEPTASNYQWFAAVLLSAFLNHKVVNIAAEPVGNWCQIDYVEVFDEPPT